LTPFFPDITLLQEELCLSRQREKQMRVEISALRRDLQNKSKVIISLRKKIRFSTSKKFHNSLIRKAFLQRFSVAQTNYFLNKNVRARRWSQEDIINGLILRGFSRRAYHYLRKKKLLPLPGVTTLKTWIKNFRCNPGVQTDLLNILSSKLAGNFPDDYRDCILSFDEMSIKHCYEYHHGQDKIYGPNKKLQLAVLRGLFHKWKMPVFFDFDITMNKQLLLQLITETENHNARVRGVACDLGNHKLVSELEIIPSRSFFKHPCDDARNVFFFPDVPHLLKLLRNHLIDQGFQWNNGIQIEKKDLEPLLSKDSKELKIHPKLTKEHLDCQQNARQRVRMAAQLMSHTTATALKTLFPEKTNQASFIELVDSW
jgi:hypothetical protein